MLPYVSKEYSAFIFKRQAVQEQTWNSAVEGEGASFGQNGANTNPGVQLHVSGGPESSTLLWY